MIRYLLDTDTTSFLLKKNHAYHKNVMQNLLKMEEGTVGISVMTVSEIACGIKKIKNDAYTKKLILAIEYIFSSLVVLEFNDDAAWKYGEVRGHLLEAGQDIGVMDSLIAAHALSQNLIMVTNNIKHFSRIPKIKLENWV